MNLPIRLRLTLWYSALLAGALIIFSATVYLATTHAMTVNIDSDLRQQLHRQIAEFREGRGSASGLIHLDGTDSAFTPSALVSPAGRVLIGHPPPIVVSWLRRTRASPGDRLASLGSIRVVVHRVTRDSRPIGSIVVWQSIRAIDAARHVLFLVLLATGLVVVLIAGIGGLALARRALRPVSDLTRTADAIGAFDLSRRVPLSPTHDELHDLAVTFNAMIDRLAGAVQRERSFTRDASHELRTPLAVIRAESSLALEHVRTAEHYRSVLMTIDSQAADMEELIAALLLLARVEADPQVSWEEIDIASLVEEALPASHRLIDRPDVRFVVDIPPRLRIHGNSSLLVRAIRNLIENAVKHSPADGTVSISAERGVGAATLDITDEGHGIPPEHIDHIFEPFYQVSPHRTPGGGYGLGLAICRRIVESHGGSVNVESRPGSGTRFRIMLPLLASGALSPPAATPAQSVRG